MMSSRLSVRRAGRARASVPFAGFGEPGPRRAAGPNQPGSSGHGSCLETASPALGVRGDVQPLDSSMPVLESFILESVRNLLGA